MPLPFSETKIIILLAYSDCTNGLKEGNVDHENSYFRMVSLLSFTYMYLVFPFVKYMNVEINWFFFKNRNIVDSYKNVTYKFSL